MHLTSDTYDGQDFYSIPMMFIFSYYDNYLILKNRTL